MKLVLMELVRQVRGHTLRLLQTEDAPWQRWSPPGTSNHFLWHAGHILWVQDLLTLQALGYPSELQANWEERFGPNCRPVTSTGEWPAIAEMRDLLHQQQDRLVKAIEGVDIALQKPPPSFPKTSWGLIDGIVHACHDEARHHGEMYLLYKMTRAAAT